MPVTAGDTLTSPSQSAGQLTAKETTTNNCDGLDFSGNLLQPLEVLDLSEQGQPFLHFFSCSFDGRQVPWGSPSGNETFVIGYLGPIIKFHCVPSDIHVHNLLARQNCHPTIFHRRQVLDRHVERRRLEIDAEKSSIIKQVPLALGYQKSGCSATPTR